MAVTLKPREQATVIDALRAVRRADDVVSTLHAGSFEHACDRVRAVVEADDWSFGPATLLSTYQHHAVCKTRDGKLVRVEWVAEQDKILLTNPKVFSTPVPVQDIGHELFATAKAAVEQVFAENYSAVDPMLKAMTEAVNTDGPLKRRLDTELALRSINRAAWWHKVVAEHYEQLLSAPPIRTEGQNLIAGSVDDLLVALKQSAASVSESIKRLAERKLDAGVESIARDVATDTANAILALNGADRNNESEMLNVYEAVVSVTNYLLSGADFLAQLAKTTE